jgi:L-2-hydroxyglutarate oxidase LhgO
LKNPQFRRGGREVDGVQTERVETVVIGAGVVGLACARALALAGREVIVLEASETVGSGISSRNSEVVHAGIYYPEGSLKTELCVAGRRALYRYCETRGVPVRRCGKLIVATTAEEEPKLARIAAQAEANGVTGDEALQPLGADAAQAMEPALFCTRALFSPSSGIIDSHALMLSYLGEAEAAGAMIAFGTPVLGGAVRDAGILVDCGGDAPMRLLAREVVIAGGLHSQSIAAALRGFPSQALPGAYYCKGSYFTLSGRPFSRLIYPVPQQAGLGVHVTVDIGGAVRFGPDTEWIDGLEDPDVYDVDPDRAAGFAAAIRRYYPDLDEKALSPGYAGIRPKLSPRGAVGDDFRIDGPDTHGIPGLVCLFGVESPGLTASLAVGARTARLLGVAEPDIGA